jgi:hypothetical protein
MRSLDDHYAAASESGEGVSKGLVGVILNCLPLDICNCVFLPADGTISQHLAITFKPAFRSYVTFVAEYWAGLVHSRMPIHQESVTEHIKGSESSIPSLPPPHESARFLPKRVRLR